jgi:pyridoxal phosphate enzyme (YggS family)
MHMIEDRYQAVQDRIAAAAQRAGRSADEITLVAVTKTWPAEVVAAAYKVGLRHFGENRAEELADKRPAVAALLGGAADEITWHLIGPLQSRKTSLAADHADYFHALDRLKIARRLSNQLVANGRAADRPLPVLLEVNVSGEGSKAGFDCSRWEEDERQRRHLSDIAAQIAELPGLSLSGLMTMAPWEVAPEIIRAVFRRTRTLSDWLKTAVPAANWASAAGPRLSMGMTDDFEIAIEEGASHIRVGRAIFGPRH